MCLKFANVLGRYVLGHACGLAFFLTPQLSRSPIYVEVLERVKKGHTLMDIGTFLGHDLRRLVYDGAPSDNLFGVDIVNFYDLGYEFFRDREHFKGQFIEANFLSTDSSELAALRERKASVIVISQVLHQWGWDDQLKATEALVAFTQPGTMIVGNMVGNDKAQEVSLPSIPTPAWRHNADSFAQLFQEVGGATGTVWETKVWPKTLGDMGWNNTKDTYFTEDGCNLIDFMAKRIK
ncbi:hypothetical protein F5Y18DRAFT_60761 [Xylariaceae sp. FL1019]|nr:hypothetical protein F5Y18DRAFT_60761 [Xylariaceae sp. FL1019]